MSACKDAPKDNSIFFRMESEKGWLEVGNEDIWSAWLVPSSVEYY